MKNDATQKELAVNNKSVLWTDSTLQNDRIIVSELVEKWVSGSTEHKEACVEKIMQNIQTKAWQNLFSHRIFVFSAHSALNGHFVEIKFSLNCQTIDALYFIYTKDKNAHTKQFDYKIRQVFSVVYGHEMNMETANIIRIIRNNVIHTGSVDGMPGRHKDNDLKSMRSYASKHQFASDKQLSINMASTFNYLIGDLIVRVLGLTWDELSYNLRPPSRLNVFYDL